MENKNEIDIINLIVWGLNFLKRYVILFIVFVILGVGAGLADFYLGRNYYSTKFIASSPVINNQIVFELVEPIKFYIAKEMYDSVALKLDIPVDAARDIREMKLDTTLTQAVLISIELYGKENTAVIQNGFVSYLNSIPYVKSTIEGKRKELEIYLKDLNTEIDELNDLQATLLKIAKENNNTNLSVGSVFNEMMTLYDRRLVIQAEYNSLQSFKVINNNMVFDAENSLFKSLILFSAIGLFLALILSVIIEIKKKVKLKKSEK